MSILLHSENLGCKGTKPCYAPAHGKRLLLTDRNAQDTLKECLGASGCASGYGMESAKRVLGMSILTHVISLYVNPRYL